MDYIQFSTMIAIMIGFIGAVYHATDKRIDRIDNRMDLFQKTFDENMKHMNQKWERLFERLLIQDSK